MIIYLKLEGYRCRVRVCEVLGESPFRKDPVNPFDNAADRTCTRLYRMIFLIPGAE